MSEMQPCTDTQVMDQGPSGLDGRQANTRVFVDEARAELNCQLASLGLGANPETLAAIRVKFEAYLAAYLDWVVSDGRVFHRASKLKIARGIDQVRALGDNA